MAIQEHPKTGTVVMCDYNSGFREPEMVKRRPVIIISPKIRHRTGLCTVVALSTTPPNPKLPYHCQIDLWPELPKPFVSKGIWVKGDMINVVGFHRLNLIRLGSGENGKRLYRYDTVSVEELAKIRRCILSGIGLESLTKHL